MPDPSRRIDFHASQLIGRTAELLRAHHVLGYARTGKGQVLLISGEAGIGKSRLIRDAVAPLAGGGAGRGGVLTGRCYEQDRALPYAPLIDLLRSLPLAQLSQRSPLAHLLPELGETPALNNPEQDKRLLFEALVATLIPSMPPMPSASHPSNPSPFRWERGAVIVIEDLHWADEASLEFLLYLARRIGKRPVLLAMTYRGDEVGAALERFLAALDRERLASEIELKRLTEAETALLIRAVFNMPRSPQPEFLSAIHQLTDGNPFFVEEVLKSFVAAGEIFEVGGQWGRKPLSQLRVPRTVQAAVRQRTEQLSADAQHLLNIAAVAGQRWNYAVLQRLTGHDDAAMTAHIKALLAAQLVVEESSDSFAFRHALTRQAIYSRLLARERSALHGAIGEAIEQLYPQQHDSRLSELAYHFYEADMWQKTLAYAQRAAEHAQALGAPRAAIEQWSRAIRAGQSLKVSKTFRLYQLHHARGQAHETLGRFDEARADFVSALDAARAAHDSRIAWRCLLDLGFLYTSRDFAVARGYFDEALAVARTLNDNASLAHTLNRVGNWHVNCEQPREGERLHREALALFEGMHDETGIAATLDLLAGALFLGGDLPAGMAQYTQATERFRAHKDRRNLSSSLVWLVHRGTVLNSMLAVAPAAECAGSGHEALALAQEIDWRAGESFAKVVLGMCWAQHGDYDRGLALLHDGIAIAQDINHAQGLIVGLFGLGALYLDTLALDKAEEILTRGLARTRLVNILFGDRLYSALLGLTYVVQGELAKAREVLNAVIGAQPSELPLQPTLAQRLCWLARGELALAEGNPADALAIADGLITSAQRTAQDGMSAPRLLKLRGKALAALQRWDEADAAL